MLFFLDLQSQIFLICFSLLIQFCYTTIPKEDNLQIFLLILSVLASISPET